jgi:trans-2,3-dihydro-3-hydroxyanthranilate isomerase
MQAMRLKFHTLDVFTDQKFAGNPLAVVHDADDLTTEQMQAITREFNLSETIFIMRPADAANTAKVRIFFPGGEMPFAGHPVVGCAVLLASLKHEGDFDAEIRLEANAGLVPLKVARRAGQAHAQFTAPVVPFEVDVPKPSLDLVAHALSLTPADIGFNGHELNVCRGGPMFFYVPVASRGALTRCVVAEPHWSEMIAGLGVDNAYVYAKGDAAPDIHARMFAPTGGIPEDPATGSATALLAAQLLKAERLSDGTHRFSLQQGHDMGRPSQLDLEVDVRAGKLIAVRVAGGAVQVMSGTLTV